MKRLLVFLTLTLCTSAFAQRELVNVFEQFNSQLEQWCPTVSTLDPGRLGLPEITAATTWLCGLSPSISRASNLLNGFTGDLNGFMGGAVNDLMGLVTDVTGLDLGDFDASTYIDAATMAVKGDLEGGAVLFAPVVGELLARASAARMTTLSSGPREGATSLEKRINASARTDPGRLLGETNNLAQTGEAVMRAAEAGDTASIAREMAATSLARGDEQQLLLRVTSPDPTGVAIPKGTADKAEDAAKLCVSTRCAAQAQLKFATDAARQDAVSTANITTAVKEMSLQQSLTTQQLATLAQGQADEQVRAINERLESYYRDLGVAMVKAQGIEDAYNQLAEFMKAATP